MRTPLPTLSVLDSISIPTHCAVPWDGMTGNERTRFCNQCNLNVHDVSELTSAEAVVLLCGEGKPPCVRVYRRPDGRVLTADCMTRRERVWKWLDRRSAWAAWLFALVFLSGCTTTMQGVVDSGVRVEPLYPLPPLTKEKSGQPPKE